MSTDNQQARLRRMVLAPNGARVILPPPQPLLEEIMGALYLVGYDAGREWVRP